MSPLTAETITTGIRDGSIVPVLGPGVLTGVTHREDGRPIPADGDALMELLAQGRPLNPKLRYEFPRVAMHFELKKGRSFVNRMLQQTYGDSGWSRAPFHDWLATLKPPYVIDLNRDTQLQDSYADTPHLLVVGTARIGGTDYRFRLFHWRNGGYTEIDQAAADPALPVLFKPLGTPRPEPTFIASDADFVDYITELMGGFAIPGFLKQSRKGRKYLLLGLRLSRDTERMVLSDIMHDAGDPAGWALLPEPLKNEQRFCAKHQLAILEQDFTDLLPLEPAAATPT